jgi:hypothetical protein
VQAVPEKMKILSDAPAFEPIAGSDRIGRALKAITVVNRPAVVIDMI